MDQIAPLIVHLLTLLAPKTDQKPVLLRIKMSKKGNKLDKMGIKLPKMLTSAAGKMAQHDLAGVLLAHLVVAANDPHHRRRVSRATTVGALW